MVNSLPEKWDRRILTFFRYDPAETWKLLQHQPKEGVSKCVPAHLGMSLLAVLWAFQVPCYTAAGMCLFYFLPQNSNMQQERKSFFRTALAIPQLEVYIIGSSLPEKWDRRILTFFSVSYNRNLEHFYNTDRSKACQNAYLRILACLCFCGFSGFQVP